MIEQCQKTALILLLLAATASASPAQVFTTLANFNGNNGAAPSYVNLAQGLDGSLYGTTAEGGSNNLGTTFKVTPEGVLTTLYNFCSQPDCSDGFYPESGLVLGNDGNFYGTTAEGGGLSCPVSPGCGTLFAMSPAGTLTTVYDFCIQVDCADGELPQAALIQAANGNFYGTTPTGGGTACHVYGCGIIFEITPEGSMTTLYTFNHADGAKPDGPLIQSIDGNLYGTTAAGGPDGDLGTIFKITPRGILTIAHGFAAGHGTSPFAGLVQASDNNFYGTTLWGGSGNGTIFRMTPAGTLKSLHDFNRTDGSGARAHLIQGTDGSLYGTTTFGGDLSCNPPFGCGTVFKITLAGKLATLHSFESTDGAFPAGGLIQATNGIFYGTTSTGGDLNCLAPVGCGTVFSLSTGLGPFVTFVRRADRVGQTFGILGQGLTGTTSVSLNGAPASFTVVSDTFIKATVPAGATTGLVTVTTPSGTLTSNVPFHVIP